MALSLHNDTAGLVIFDGIEIQSLAVLLLNENNKIGIANDFMFVSLIFDAAQTIWVEDSTRAGIKIVAQEAIDLLKAVPATTIINSSSSGGISYDVITAINTNGIVEVVFTDSDDLIGRL